MGYLFLSILSTTLVFITFRLMGQYRVHTFHTIVINYLACVLLGFLFLPSGAYAKLFELPAAFYQIGLVNGLLFVLNFWFMGKTTQTFGVAPATITARMSLIIPAFFSIFVFNEVFNLLKAIGIAAALMAIYLSLYKPQRKPSVNPVAMNKLLFLFPLGAFLGTGIIDSLFKVAQVEFLMDIPNVAFLLMLFGVAGFAGLLVILGNFFTQTQRWENRTIPWGILLGIFNFFGIYFLLVALSKSQLAGSVLFPINSVSIVVLSTLASFFIFKEQLNTWNKVGFILAIAAILFITFA